MPRFFDAFQFVFSVKYALLSRAAFAPFVEEVSRTLFSFETPVAQQNAQYVSSELRTGQPQGSDDVGDRTTL